MDKYYQPTQEEFHIGFEYEINDTWGGYKKVIFKDFGPVSIGSGNDRVPYDYKARVKCLDTEDIESLGYEHLGALWFENKETDCRIRKWKGDELDFYTIGNLR